MNCDLETDDELKDAVVIDNGGASIRAGFAGRHSPTVTFPTIVGKTKHFGQMVCFTYVGTEAESQRDVLNCKYPIECDIITDWDAMTSVWHHTLYKELLIDPAEHPVLLTEPPLNPKMNREKACEVMFETFSVPALSVHAQSVLTLLSGGRKTGMVLESGNGTAVCVPIYESHCLPANISRSATTGGQLTNYMTEMITKKYPNAFSSSRTDFDIAKNIKEQLCYVAFDFKHELNTMTASSVERSYTLPNKDIIVLGSERFSCPEAHFDPSLLHLEMPGIHRILYRAIELCDSSIRSDLYANIQLSGGSTLFPGFNHRLQKEVALLAPTGTEVRVHTPPHGLISAWVGGSIIASKENYLDSWFKADVYDEYGPSFVHRICI